MADERTRHLATIASIAARWQAGHIGLEDKRRLIDEENARYYGEQGKNVPKRLLTRRPDADIERTLVEVTGAPVEQVAAALAAARAGSVAASNAERLADDIALAAAGRRAHDDILFGGRELRAVNDGGLADTG